MNFGKQEEHNQITIPINLLVDDFATIVFDLEYNDQPVAVYPNPFSQKTMIYFKLNKSFLVCLEIFDSKGKKVRTLINNSQKVKGEHHIQWDGKNDSNIELPYGTYIYNIVIDKSYSGKILLRK